MLKNEGAPIENTDTLHGGLFSNKLHAFVNATVFDAIHSSFTSEAGDLLQISPLGSDFTSFLRRVTFEERTLVAKMSFDSSKPRLIDEYGDSTDGLARLMNKPVFDVASEYARHQFLHSIFPLWFPRPIHLEGVVAFYEYIPGQTLERSIIDQNLTDLRQLGEFVRVWHNRFEVLEVPDAVQAACLGKLDRLSMYQRRYATAQGIETAFRPLEGHEYMDAESTNTLIATLVEVSARLNVSSVLGLPKDTWGHGDLKPENVLIHEGSGDFYIIDNDMHLQPEVLDVAKMISRIVLLGFHDTASIEYLQMMCQSFLEGYYGEATIPYEQIADVIAMDMLVIFGSYTAIPKDKLLEYPEMAQLFMANIPGIVSYMWYLTGTSHNSLESIVEFFKR